jgi:hypothetical protein
VAGNREFDAERFWAVFHYIGEATLPFCVGPEGVFTLMFLADMDAYRLLGQALTGAQWMKPSPADGWQCAMTWPA